MLRMSRFAKAPRVLNEPACCKSSSLKLGRPASNPKSAPFVSITGVRRICGLISRSAAAMSCEQSHEPYLFDQYGFGAAAFYGPYCVWLDDVPACVESDPS